MMYIQEIMTIIFILFKKLQPSSYCITHDQHLFTVLAFKEHVLLELPFMFDSIQILHTCMGDVLINTELNFKKNLKLAFNYYFKVERIVNIEARNIY